jgi:hypothetical protein
MEKTLEQFVQMTAMVHANNKDFQKMFAHFGIDDAKWQAIAAHWMARIGSDPELGARFQKLMMAEVARLERAGAASNA